MVLSKRIVAYTYYSAPWRRISGDDVRIHSIVGALRRYLELNMIVIYSLSLLPAKEDIFVEGNGHIVYIPMPRHLYTLLAKVLRWKDHHDLNPLAKLTHYIDEFIASFKLKSNIKPSDALYIFGSMSLLSLFMRILGWKGTIIYDPLANYAQTLYLRSRSGLKELLRYGLYLALHKLQLKHSNFVVYPSRLDLENARRMFGVRNAAVVPNPAPICFKSYEEYEELRKMRKDDEKLHFVLLAGGRNKANEEAVKSTINIFNKLPPKSFQLYITGPWRDMKVFVKNDSIKLLGVIPHTHLKKILAMSDCGLSPIFSHASGTFLKVLAYIAAGLNIIASPLSLMGLDIRILRERYGYNGEIYLIHDAEEYGKIVSRLVYNKSFKGVKRPVLCRYIEAELVNAIREAGIPIKG